VPLVLAQPHQQGAGDDDHQQDHHHHHDEEALEVVAAEQLAGQVAEQAGHEAEGLLDAAAAGAAGAPGAFAAARDAAFGAADGAGPAAAAWLAASLAAAGAAAAFLRVLRAWERRRAGVRGKEMAAGGCRWDKGWLSVRNICCPTAPELWGSSVPRVLAPSHVPRCLAGINQAKPRAEHLHGAQGQPQRGRATRLRVTGTHQRLFNHHLLHAALHGCLLLLLPAQQPAQRALYGGSGVGHGAAPVTGLAALECNRARACDPLHLCLLTASPGAGFLWEPGGQVALRVLDPEHGGPGARCRGQSKPS